MTFGSHRYSFSHRRAEYIVHHSSVRLLIYFGGLCLQNMENGIIGLCEIRYLRVCFLSVSCILEHTYNHVAEEMFSSG